MVRLKGAFVKASMVPSNSSTVPNSAPLGKAVSNFTITSSAVASPTPSTSSFGLLAGVARSSVPLRLGSGVLCSVAK